MKRILYGNLVGKSRPSLREEGEGDIMTKAILDVDDCVEGMRKFTTEVFDTGAGKSTLFKLLLGLYELQEGEVLVGGIPAGQSWQNRRSCFWMRLLQTWMPRWNTRCCRH